MVACILVIDPQLGVCETTCSVDQIRLRTYFLDFSLKAIRLDNASEFTSQIFDDYFMFVGISIEHSAIHIHTQNSLVESLIQSLQLIAITLL